jgi:hypothetical protein
MCWLCLAVIPSKIEMQKSSDTSIYKPVSVFLQFFIRTDSAYLLLEEL